MIERPSLSLDFETRSTVDLPRTGVYPYAQHHTTDIWCMAYSFNDDVEVDLWAMGDPVPDAIVEHVEFGGEMRAWNAEFERVMWEWIMTRRYGFPKVSLEQWVCTAAEGAAMGLPRSLEKAAEALGLDIQKDMAGNRLMKQMCRPRAIHGDVLEWWDDAERRSRLHAYCKTDVATEKAVKKVTRRLSPQERRVWIHDQRINSRGVFIDMKLVRAAKKFAAIALDRANANIRALTDGDVEGVTKVKDFTRFLQEKGVAIDNLRKDTVRDLLKTEITGALRDLVEIRAEAGRTSVAKLDAMEQCVCRDWVARGLLLYHAASTGRWAGKLIQPQNFPRPDVKSVEKFIPLVMAGDVDAVDLEAAPLAVIASMLRSMITARPGRRFVAADFAGIEARGVAWLAGQWDLVKMFAGGGKLYEDMAGTIYNRDPAGIPKDSVERFVGKETVLGCGFQMSGPTFGGHLQKKAGIILPEAELRRIVKAYREKYPKIPELWRNMNGAAIQAVQSPGTPFYASHTTLRFVKTGAYLWMILPSGRPLAYAAPRIVMRTMPWDLEPCVDCYLEGTEGEYGADDCPHKRRDKRPAVEISAVNSLTKQWERTHLYGGLLTENAVQAIARDVMAEAMGRVEDAGYPVVLTVHDEIITEPVMGHGDVEEFKRIMTEVPSWADKFPVAVDGWEGPRYRK